MVLTRILPAFEPSGERFVASSSTNGGLVLIETGTHASRALYSRNGQAAMAATFFVNRERGEQVALIKPDGSGFREITSGPNNNGFPSLSSDGKRCVYRTLGPQGQGLRIMNLEDSSVSTLTTDYDNFPLWSPRGDIIIFTRKYEGDFELFSIRPDGKDLRRLTNSPGNEGHCAWSPDGDWILFSSARMGFKDETLYTDSAQPYGELFVMRFDGTVGGRYGCLATAGAPAVEPMDFHKVAAPSRPSASASSNFDTGYNSLRRSDMTDSRRDFVRKAAGAFTIVAPEAVRGSQANSTISLGLIGVGGRGSYDASIANADPRARVTALCDLFDDRIEKGTQTIKAQNPVEYKDFEKLLAAPDIDAVIIATPPFEHPRMLEAAIQAKKHVYCEKPMGVDLAGCKRVMAAAKKADPKKCVSVGFQQRYGPVYLEAYKRLQEGQIGEIANARAAWIANDPFKRVPYPDPKVEKLRNWFCYKDLSGDFIVEQDCHNFDVLHWFLNARPISAVGMGGKKVRTTMDIMDHLTLSFQFPNGIHVNFEANQLTPPGFRRIGEEFTGTKGVLATSRDQLVHTKGPGNVEVMKSRRDITMDGIEQFLGRVQSGNVENVAERSAISTLFAILGRTAIYNKRETTWKGEFGSV